MAKLKSVRVAIHLEFEDRDDMHVTTPRFCHKTPVHLAVGRELYTSLEKAVRTHSVPLLWDLRELLTLSGLPDFHAMIANNDVVPKANL